MVEIKKDSLEDAFNPAKKEENSQPVQPKISKEMEIGFHQGTLTTLLNERNELVKMVKQVETILQAHMKRLEELGVKIQVNSGKKE
jgi:DNA polymerase elongation subunit (family B)